MRLRCKIGIHKRETIRTVKCSAHRSELFGFCAHKVDAIVMIKRCVHCDIHSAWLSDGHMTKFIDYDFVMAQIGG